jgi:hypothetical protein
VISSFSEKKSLLSQLLATIVFLREPSDVENAVRRNFNPGPCTVQLSTRVLTNFEINLAPSAQAVPLPYLFLNYYRPGLLFADFGDAKTLVRRTRNHIGQLSFMEVLGLLASTQP